MTREDALRHARAWEMAAAHGVNLASAYAEDQVGRSKYTDMAHLLRLVSIGYRDLADELAAEEEGKEHG